MATFGDPAARGRRVRDAAVGGVTGAAAVEMVRRSPKHLRRFTIPAAVGTALMGQRRFREMVLLPPSPARTRQKAQSRFDWLGTPKDFTGLSARERAAAEAGDWNRWVGRDAPTPDKNWNSLMARAKRAGVIGSDTTPGR